MKKWIADIGVIAFPNAGIAIGIKRLRNPGFGKTRDFWKWVSITEKLKFKIEYISEQMAILTR